MYELVELSRTPPSPVISRTALLPTAIIFTLMLDRLIYAGLQKEQLNYAICEDHLLHPGHPGNWHGGLGTDETHRDRREHGSRWQRPCAAQHSDRDRGLENCRN